MRDDWACVGRLSDVRCRAKVYLATDCVEAKLQRNYERIEEFDSLQDWTRSLHELFAWAANGAFTAEERVTLLESFDDWRRCMSGAGQLLWDKRKVGP